MWWQTKHRVATHAPSLTTSVLPLFTRPTLMGLLPSLVQELPAAGPDSTVSVMLLLFAMFASFGC